MQTFSGGSRWTFYKGAQQDDSSSVGTFDMGKPSTADGIKAGITESKGGKIALRLSNSGFWASVLGKQGSELTLQGEVVAKVRGQTFGV